MIVDPMVFNNIFVNRLTATGKLWKPHYLGVATHARRFRSYYGIDYEDCAILWNKLYTSNPDQMVGWKPKHLLDALFFLKVYASEEVNAGLSGCDEKTLRKWNWTIIKAIAELDCVRFLTWILNTLSLYFTASG